ncbi:MAG: helix-hairpin-helix domain-containing protein [Paludibacteraceae bacterium]|nr:helix-hairpin-helix domain-containing protein [Paludibacteraceae bacterium]
MKRQITIVLVLITLLFPIATRAEEVLSVDDIILDIYHAVTELGETDYEQIQSDLYALHNAPINLNSATEEQLEQLYFLSPRQIDDILAYVDHHPMNSVYELRLIPSLADYEIRDLLPFIYVAQPQASEKMIVREVFSQAKHELLARVDARNCEAYDESDPIYTQIRYTFDYRHRVRFGAQLRRPAGGDAESLQYGGYIHLRDIGHLHTLVAGNFQASFGQGLVLAPVFHTGKSAYVNNVGLQQEGLRYYSSVDGEGLHGAGATFRHNFSKRTRLDISGLYSMRRANDSTWHHLLGANMTLRHKRLQVEITAIENLWTDSIHPYRNAAYNQHYFRGRRQAVLGSSIRYNHGWFDLFGEVATAQNREQETGYGRQETSYGGTEKPHWGIGTIVGSRFYPTTGLSLMLLYRYYSPWFDNALGYAFSETSRIGDENGGYAAFELTRIPRWRISGYGDVFYFSGRKYGINYAPSWGYDALIETRFQPSSRYYMTLRLRAKEKGKLATYSTRYLFDYKKNGWSLRTTMEANMTRDSLGHIGYGVSAYQDVQYTFRTAPVSLRGRIQFFDAREWNNRIYCYEHDVLYAYSIPAVYGLGGRAYLCLRWQIIEQLALYLRVSETLIAPKWYEAKHPEWSPSDHMPLPSRTDVHLLLRATL